jgi:hypothetical protein
MWKSGTLGRDVTTADIQLIVDQPAEYKLAETVKFGFSAGTGGRRNYHAVWGFSVAPADPALSDTVYIVPSNTSVTAGLAATYPFKVYKDAAMTQELLGVTPNGQPCTSTYSTTVDYRAPNNLLDIDCSAAVLPGYKVVATAKATLTVNRGTPTIAPSRILITGTTGTAITPTTAFISRNFLFPNTLVYTISPALPSGLVINSATGVISGTPLVPFSTPLTVTARSDGESATASVTFAITGTAIENYTIKYVANGGTGTMANQVGTGPATLSRNTFTRNGFAFSGWKDETGKSYKETETVTLTSGQIITLSAQWVESKVPAISPAVTTISAITGALLAPTSGYTAVNFTGAVTYSISPAIPAGLNFSTTTGAITGTPTTAKAISSYVVTAVSATESATAQVDIVITSQVSFPYAISYEANGGSGTMSGQTGTGASVKLSANTFTKAGSTFTGWKDDQGVSYTDGQVVEIKQSTSLALHAQWSANNGGNNSGGAGADNLLDKII